MHWTNRTRWRSAIAGCALIGATVLLVVSPAAATPANFANSGFGFEAAGLEGLPVGTIDPTTPFLLAGAPGTGAALDVELVGSQELCILAASDNVCRPNVSGVSGPFSAFVMITIDVINTVALPGEFTLFLNSLVGTRYDFADVSIALNPTVPTGLDTSAVPRFNGFNGTFDPIVHLALTAPGDSTALFDYIGWTVQDGATIPFRYDVNSAPVDGFAPQLSANAAPVVVPEPGTAILIAIGLTGLSLCSNRRR